MPYNPEDIAGGMDQQPEQPRADSAEQMLHYLAQRYPRSYGRNGAALLREMDAAPASTYGKRITWISPDNYIYNISIWQSHGGGGEQLIANLITPPQPHWRNQNGMGARKWRAAMMRAGKLRDPRAHASGPTAVIRYRNPRMHAMSQPLTFELYLNSLAMSSGGGRVRFQSTRGSTVTLAPEGIENLDEIGQYINR